MRLGLLSTTAPAAVDRNQPSLPHVELLLLHDLPAMESALAQRLILGPLRRRSLFEGDNITHSSILQGQARQIASASNTQAVIKARPPKGVMAPIHRIPLRLNA